MQNNAIVNIYSKQTSQPYLIFKNNYKSHFNYYGTKVIAFFQGSMPKLKIKICIFGVLSQIIV